MRSLLFTVLLAFVAAATAGLAVMHLTDGNLAQIFGAPPTPTGENLYQFEPSKVSNIYLTGNGVSAHCRNTPSGWQMVQPWKDRMDPRVAQAIFQFSLGARVEGSIPREKVESAGLQFDDGQIGFGFTDAEGETIAKFVLGRRTAWLGTDPETGETIPTVFIEPLDRGRKDYLYACIDPTDIHSVLNDGFKGLRDHHPFLFHPTMVESLRVKNKTGEMLLSRDHPKQLWSIVKPLGLKSDSKTLIALLQGLYDLRAIKVVNRSEVTLPAEDSKTIEQIALKFFGAEDEIVLEIYPPENPEATTVLAKASNRPDSVFELPLIGGPTPNGRKKLIGLNQLPLSVNALRDPTLTSINHLGLKSILLSPANGDDIILQRASPKDRFSILLEGKIQEPSVLALNALIKTVTEAKVSAFVSDTATDLKPYGLEQPFLLLRFASFGGEIIQLTFGQGQDGDIHAIREGTTTVVKIDPSVLTLIPTRSWDWKDPQIFNIAPTDVTGIRRRIGDSPLLELGYAFNSEKWIAKQGNEDLSLRLVKNRADRLLDTVLDLKANTWLRNGHTTAGKALQKPRLRLDLLVKQFNNEAKFLGMKQRTIEVGENNDGEKPVFYGRIDGGGNPFILTKEQVNALEEDLFVLDWSP